MYLPVSAQFAEKFASLSALIGLIDQQLASGATTLRASVVAQFAEESIDRAESVMRLYEAEDVLVGEGHLTCLDDNCGQLVPIDGPNLPKRCSQCNGDRLSEELETVYRITASGKAGVVAANAGAETTEWAKEISDYRGKVDFVIITIKPEEEDAVLRRFPREHTVHGERKYGLCRTETRQGGRVLVATVRQPKQGNEYATNVTKDVINDLDPAWILLVGIGGASPFGDAVVGDVVFGTHVHDLTVQARNADGSTEFSPAGGAVTQDVETTVTHLRSPLQKAMKFPSPGKALDLTELKFTTKDKDVNKRIKTSLATRFARGYAPKILDGPIVSTDALIKDVELVKQWKSAMRNVLAIDMESAGAHNAARSRVKTYAMLPIRGISDIVGMEKQEGWVLHACEIAAESAFEFVRNWSPA